MALPPLVAALRQYTELYETGNLTAEAYAAQVSKVSALLDSPAPTGQPGDAPPLLRLIDCMSPKAWEWVPEPEWLVFLGNVSGRSILTTMVHIVSSGVIGYFLGLAIFAKSFLEDIHKKGDASLLADFSYWILRIPPKDVFKPQALITGVVIGTVLHGLFNFMVTLPDLLPGNPETFGELLNLSPGNLLSRIPILLLPSFMYIVGGFWIFTILFFRQESVKERGRVVVSDTYVKGEMAV